VVVLGALAPAGALVAGLAPAAAAAPPACRVKNPTQDTWFATWSGQALTRAIAAANPGDHPEREHPDPQPDRGQRQRPRRLRLPAAVTGL
jgi:hypothetical protein